MTVDDATLLAYADGMLAPDEARAVERAVARDRGAADKLRLMRDSAQLVRDAHARAFTAPVPGRLSTLLRPRTASVRRRTWPRWLPALAASACALAIGFVVGRALFEPPGVVSLASAGQASASQASALDDMTAFALIVALDGGAPSGGSGPQVTILGDVDAGLGVPCRRFAVGGATPLRGLACEGGDGTWSLLLLPGPPS
jgi:anti-sigma factor RsiW